MHDKKTNTMNKYVPYPVTQSRMLRAAYVYQDISGRLQDNYATSNHTVLLSNMQALIGAN